MAVIVKGERIYALLKPRVHVGLALLTEVVLRDLVNCCIAHAVTMLPCLTRFTHGHEFARFILPFELLSNRSSHDNRIGPTSFLTDTARYSLYLILWRVDTGICATFQHRGVIPGWNVYLEVGLIFLLCLPLHAPVGYGVWCSFWLILCAILCIVDLSAFVTIWVVGL